MVAKRREYFHTMFGPTGGGMWFSGQLNAGATKVFKEREIELRRVYRKVYGCEPSAVSKANVIEFALRGPKNAEAILHALKAGG